MTVDPDPFGTAALRSAVLSAWTASPARFREDANAEEALSRGYADRVLVELTANGVDAARSAGVPAVVRISVHDAEIRLANTGTPLTSAGVAALASLRASAKRDDDGAVGHFGVGFTAVRAVTAEPRVVSTTGGVLFSADRTAELVRAQGIPGLDAELVARHGVPPALRLCWPASADEPGPPAGFATEVRLPVPDPAAAVSMLALWSDAVMDHLFWALPGLQAVELPGRVIGRHDLPRGHVEITDAPTDAVAVVSTFDTASRSGVLPAVLLAERPVEERDRNAWHIGWSLAGPSESSVGQSSGPVDPFADALRGADPGTGVATIPLCAPTPTDELLTLPARLVGTFPVDETRRRLVAGDITDLLLEAAAAGYLDLVASLPPERRWSLVPPAGFPAGEIDARLRAGILRGWAERPLLTSVLGDPLTPDAALSVRGVDSETLALLAEALPGLVEVTSAAHSAARTLGVQESTVAAVVDALSGITRPPAYWAAVYRGLAGFDAEELAGLPVPLVDGRQVLGARGVLVPDASVQPLARRIAAVLPGLRWVHPEAQHPLLLRLGALAADPTTVLGSSALEQEIRRLADDLAAGELDPDDLLDSVDGAVGDGAVGDISAGDGSVGDTTPGDVAALVLDLLAAGGRGEPALLAALVLTDDTGEPWPAGELMTPSSPLRPLIDSDDLPSVEDRWTERWGADVLRQVGVRTTPLVIGVDDRRAADLLPGLDDWLDSTPVSDSESAVGVADLNLIDDWAAFLPILAADRESRDAVLSRSSWTAWWLREHVRLDERPTVAFHGVADTDVLAGLFDPLPFPLPEPVATAIGVAGPAVEVIADHPQLVLDRFCDPSRTVTPAAVPVVAGLLVDRLADAGPDHPEGDLPDEVDLPDGMRALDGRVAAADRVLVADGPWWGQLLPAGRLLAVPGHDPAVVADVFGLQPAVGTVLTMSGDPLGADPRVADTARRQALAAAVVGEHGVDVTLVPTLTVTGPDGARQVGWWPGAGTVLHDGSDDGLAAAVAWSSGHWSDRHRVLAALRGDDDAEIVAAVWDS